MARKVLEEKVRDQLNAIPSLNEYFNRLPCKTKEWIIEAVIQAFKEYVEDMKSNLPDGLSSDHEIMACCIYNSIIDSFAPISSAQNKEDQTS